MTRKKSNVKALALAVTCAILAGGYSGLNPVYAGENVTFDSSTKKISATNEITQLEINGVFIGTNNTSGTPTMESGRIEAGNIFSSTVTAGTAGFNALTIQTTPSGSSITMHEGAITATGNVTAGQFTVGTQSITADKITSYDVVVTAVGDTNTGLVKDVNDLKATVGDTNNGLVQKTTKISYDATENTTKVDGNFWATGNVTANAAGFNNLAVTDGLTVGDNSTTPDAKFVNMKDGNVVATGKVKSKTIATGTTGDEFTVDENGNVVAKGSLSAANGKFKVETDGTVKVGTDKFTVDGATGNTTVGGTLGVTGDATFGGNIKGQSLNIGATGTEFTVDTDGAVKAAGGKVIIDKDGNAQFGDTGTNITKIAGNKITTGYIDTDSNIESNIGGVKFKGGVVEATTIKATDYEVKNLKVENTLQVGTTGNTTLTDGTLKLGTEENRQLTADKLGNINATIKSGQVIDAKSGTIGGVAFSATGEITAVKNITAEKGTIGNVGLEDGQITAAKGGTIGGVVFDNTGNITTANGEVKAKSFKVDEDNYFNNNGIKAKGGTIGAAEIDGTTLTVGGTKLDKTDGITTNKLTIGGMTLTDTKLDTGTADFQVNGVTFNQGQVTAAADKGFVTGTSSFKQGSLIVSDSNKLVSGSGLITEKAAVNGNLDVTGEATFGNTGNQTKINGNVITTDTLKTNKLILGAEGTTTVEVDKDGSFKAANGKFEVSKEGALKAADGAFYVDATGKTTFKKDDTNLSSINGGNIWAKATDTAANASSELLHNYKGLRVSGTKSGQTSSFDFDTEVGVGTFTGLDGTTTTINGSKITSTNGSATGELDGSNMTLDDGTNKTELTAGGATFNGAAGSSNKHGTMTTINGGTITTDTLKVERIELGENLIDTDGNATNPTFGANLSMDKDGNFSAAGGNFTIVGGSGANKGAMTNVVGNTTVKTDVDGASMGYDNGSVKSNVSVGDDNANMSSGNASVDVKDGSITSKVGDSASSTIKGDSITDKVGSTTVETKDGSFSVKGDTNKGMEIDTSTGKTTFTGAKYKDDSTGTTTIDGDTITTGKLVTDQLVIKGNGSGDTSGDGGESGSIAFGGDGTITSNIKDGDNETTFKTEADGVNTKVTDGTNTTTNKVTASGNTNTVFKGTDEATSNEKSSFTQTTTSIGGVVTNGTVKIAQTLDGKNGNITSEVTDKDGNSSKLVQNGKGLEYTDSTNTENATRINSNDVSIGSATDDSKRINLSDLGQIDDLDSELQGREEFSSNKTAVGGINAEAAIRREEIARLDNRIDDVNERVDKVGAMAAAIASLKSIGYDPQAPSEFSVGLGQYKGETGVAMGFFHYPNKNFMVNVSLSTAGGETMGGIGATWRFGHKSPQKLLDEQREAQAKKELAAAEKYKVAAQLAKEAQERAEYAAKLARQAQVSADNAKAAADATQAKHFGK